MNSFEEKLAHDNIHLAASIITIDPELVRQRIHRLQHDVSVDLLKDLHMNEEELDNFAKRI